MAYKLVKVKAAQGVIKTPTPSEWIKDKSLIIPPAGVLKEVRPIYEEMSEDRLQAQEITWFRNKYRDLQRNIWAVPNSGKRTRYEQQTMKATGLTPGVWDVHLFYMGKFIIFENKVGNNKLTTDKKVNGQIKWGQVEFGAQMQIHGAATYICYTLEHFQKACIKEIGY